MRRSFPHLSLTIAAALLVSTACTTAPVVRPKPAPQLPVVEAEKPLSKPDRPTQRALYSAEQALRDAYSSKLEYVGTGPWPGNNRYEACVFRNERVFVVNAYCSLVDAPAFRVEVYSPRRGRVRLYAEAHGAISERSRNEYFAFMVESEPPPGARAAVPRLSLGMSFGELQDYEAQRYEAYLPACYAGERQRKAQQGCLGPLEPREAEWVGDHRGFLTRPGDAWYKLVADMRRLADVYGTRPKS